MINCSGMCLFANFAIDLKQITPLLYAGTGLEAFSTSSQIMKIGERVNNLVRLFNIREGLTSELDTLPERFFSEPLEEGPSRGRLVDLSQLRQEYYFVRGWNPDGTPGDRKLHELGIAEG